MRLAPARMPSASPRGLARPSPAARRGGALALLVATASAELLIIEGPSELVGTSLLSPRYSFSPENFRVRADLVLVEKRDFANDDFRTCPGAYGGNHSLAGKIVVMVNMASDSCSSERHARALGELGAVGMVQANEGELVWDPVPGYETHRWSLGDSRALARPVAADVTSRRMVPLLSAMRAGATVRAELSPSPNEHTRAFNSWQFAFFRVWLSAQIWLVLELAVSKLYLFLRVDGGPQLSLPQMLLAVEILTCLVRVVECAVDPIHRLDFIPFELYTTLVVSQSTCLTTVSASLFLCYFAEAAASSGIASFRITARRYKLGLTIFNLGLIVSSAILDCMWFVVDTSAIFNFVMYAKVALIGAVFPSMVLLFGIVTMRKVRLALLSSSAPPLVMKGILRYMFRAICFEVAWMCIATLFLWAINGPWRRNVIQWLMYTTLIAKSFQQVACFQPIGVREWRGPANLLLDFLVRCCGRCLAPALAPLRRSVDCSMRWPKQPSGNSNRRQVAPRGGDGSTGEDAPPWRTSFSSISPSLPGSVCVPPHMLLGVTVAFMREFSRRHGFDDKTSTAAVAEVLNGLSTRDPSARHSRSACETHSSAKTADGKRAVGKAGVFVSHAQGACFVKMVAAVELYLEMHSLPPSTFVWVDVFSIRQNSVAADVQMIGATLRHIGRVVMVLDPWDRPICLTRVWCLFEVLHARDSGSHFALTMAPSERASFVNALQNAGRAHVERVLTSFDARNATAAIAKDREQIFSLIVRSFGRGVSKLHADDVVAPLPQPNNGGGARTQAGAAVATTGVRSTSDEPVHELADRCSAVESESWQASETGFDDATTEAAFDAFNDAVRLAIKGALGGLSWQL